MRIFCDRAPRLGGSCFAEAYIDGREFNLALLAGADRAPGAAAGGDPFRRF